MKLSFLFFNMKFNMGYFLGGNFFILRVLKL